MDPDQLIENMSYHRPDEPTQKEIENLRAAFHELANKVSSRCPLRICSAFSRMAGDNFWL